MSGFLPRSRSENVLKVKPSHVEGGRKEGKAYASSPELRSMLVNLKTTVPQNLRPEILSSAHQPRRRHKAPSVADFLKMTSACSCCSVRVFLIIIQIVAGCAITCVSTYIHIFVPAMKLRDKPFWAGVPLLLAGLGGVAFIEQQKKDEESTALFIIKAACSALASISVFVCVISAVFCSIHVGQLFTYAYCRHQTNSCLCYETYDTSSKTHLYSPVEDCFYVYCHIKIFLITLGSLAISGGFAAFFFVISVWKSRFGAINTQVE